MEKMGEMGHLRKMENFYWYGWCISYLTKQLGHGVL
jgi:hypothetical protein